MKSDTIDALEKLTDHKAFEHLACDILSRLTYPGIEPLGDPGDPDARVKAPATVVQASLDKKWPSKMKKDANKVFDEYGLKPKTFVFVTSRKASKKTRETTIAELEAKYPGVEFELFDQEYLRVALDDSRNHDLREQYLRIPPSPHASRWNVPIPRNPNFVGRDEDMKRLHDAIEGTRERREIVNVVGATGIGGIGKSQLAAEYAHKYRLDYPGGVYWVDAASEDLTTQFYNLGPSMGIDLPEKPTPDDVQAVVNRVMTFLRGHERSLLILDNATQPNILQGWTFQGPGWLPAGAECRVLATSRRTDLPNTTNLDIDKLDPEPAFDLLTSTRKPKGPAEKKAGERICRQVDYLPLALEIICAYLGRYSSVTFDDYSSCIEAQGALDPLDMAGEEWVSHVQGQKPVRAVLKEMTSKLEGDALKLLLAVGCFAPVSMNPSMLATVADLGTAGKQGHPAPFEKAANVLIDSSLLKRDPETGRFVSHTLVHEFARNEIGTKAQRAGAASSLFRYVGPLLNADETITMIRALLKEEPHLESAYHLAVSVEDWSWASNVANGLGAFHYKTARYDTALLWLRRALEIDEKAFGPDHPRVATEVNNIGSVLHDQGHYEGALQAFGRALEMDEKAFGPDHPRVAIRVNNIGTVLHDQGDYEGALEAYQRALKMDEKAFGPDDPNVATCLNNIGSVLHDQGDYEGALEAYSRALKIDEKAFGRDHPMVAIDVNNMGSVLKAQGDYEGALEAYRRALKIDEKAFGPDHPKAAIRVNNIGTVLHAQGDYDGALEAHERALEIDESAFGPDHPNIARDVNNIGLVLRAQGDYEGALEAFRRASEIDEKTLGPDHPNVAINANNIGSVLHDQGDYEGALEAFRRALDIHEKAFAHEHPDVAISANNVGSALAEIGKPDEGKPYLCRAYRIFKAKLGPDHPHTQTTAAWLRKIGLDPDKACAEPDNGG